MRTRSTARWLWLLLLLVFWACQTQDESPEMPAPITQRNVVTAQDIPGTIKLLKAKIGLPDHVSEFSTAGGSEDGNSQRLRINWDRILQLVDSTGRETYTFSVEDNNGTFATFYNLVLQLNADKQAYRPFLLKYEMTEEFIPIYLETGSMEKFSGKVSKIVLNSIPRHNRLNTAALEPEIGVSGTTCPGGDITYSGGIGGGGWTTTPPGIEDPEPIAPIECTTYINYTDWYNSSDGSYITTTFGSLEIECDEAPTNSSADDDGACSGLNGEIPIITPLIQTIVEIKNDVQDPCVKAFVDKASNLLLNTPLLNNLQSALKLAGEDGFELEIIEESAFSGSSTDGDTTPRNDYIIEIRLNTDLRHSSLEYIAATLYHEYLHATWMFYEMYKIAHDPTYQNAVLDKLNNYKLQGVAERDLHHTLMYDEYMQQLMDAVEAVQPGLPSDEMEAISLYGIKELTADQYRLNTEHRNNTIGTSCN